MIFMSHHVYKCENVRDHHPTKACQSNYKEEAQPRGGGESGVGAKEEKNLQ